MANESQSNDSMSGETFAEAVLGKSFTDAFVARANALAGRRGLRWLADGEWRVAVAVAVLGGLLLIPYLGAVGLWDPWETHYGEVAREMIQRNDYVHPYWENAWFFSKPVFAMWMQALGMQLVGAMRSDGALGLYTEWGFRLPFALASIVAVSLLALAVARVVSRRAGLAVGFVLLTSPLYFLISRQAVTDTPMIAAMVAAMACAIVGLLDAKTKHRAAWWYGFYVSCAFGTLAKGLLAFAFPAVILLAYAVLSVIPWDGESMGAHGNWLFSSAFRREVREGKRPMPVLWAQMFRMRLLKGVGLFAAITFPWYAVMIAFDQVDDEGRLFWVRFFLYDHFSRLGAGVHTTTPGGTFTYFIEQGGYALFPWVALLPGAMAVAASTRLRSKDTSHHLAVIAVLWLALTYTIIGSSATKFHHYVLPMLPPIAVLMALFVDRLWNEGVERHALSLLLGLPLFALVGKDLAGNPKNFTDLFVYNYDRPYPFDLVQRPLSLALFGSRSLWTGDLFAMALLGVGGYLLFDAFAGKERRVMERAMALLLTLSGLAVVVTLAKRGSVAPTLFLGLAVALVALYVVYEALRAGGQQVLPLLLSGVAMGLVGLALVVFGLVRPEGDPLLGPLTQTVNTKAALGFAFALVGVLAALSALSRAKLMLYASFWTLAMCFALWFNWSHWVDLSHHWTQRDLFWRYYDDRKPDEPIAAFLMNWRGETFYSRNTVKQIRDNAVMSQYAAQPGRKWALVEHNRLNILKSAAGPDRVVNLVERDLNNKFVLVTID